MLTNEYSQRIIKIYGDPGCGKKLIARRSLHYCIDRNFFRDGAFEIEEEDGYS